MAVILPAKIPERRAEAGDGYRFPDEYGGPAKGVRRAHMALKALPEGFRVWLGLPGEPAGPDFLVLAADGRGLLVKVSAARPGEARPAAQLLLLEDPRPPLGQEEGQALAHFMERAYAAGLSPEAPLATLVLFPELNQRQLNLARPPRTSPSPEWRGQELLRSHGQGAWEALFKAAPLAPGEVEIVRSVFSPEIVIPPEEDGGGGLLSIEQEAALKGGPGLGEPPGAWVVSGGPGSGKSTLLLMRLRLFYQQKPQGRFLVLAPGRAALGALQARFARLNGCLPAAITWATPETWCREQWPARFAWVEPASAVRRQGFIRAVWMALFKDGALSVEELRGELDWIKDQGSLKRADYLGWEGRLDAQLRARVYTAFERYQNILKDRRTLDWGDIPMRLLDMVDREQIVFPAYRAVFVDKAHVFPRVWFEILNRLASQEQGQLCLAVDPGQDFLGQGAGWRVVGTNKARSYALPPRGEAGGPDFALALLYRFLMPPSLAEIPAVEGILSLPEGVRVEGRQVRRTGKKPGPQRLQKASKEGGWAVEEVDKLIRSGTPRGEIAVLAATPAGAEALAKSLERHLGPGAVYGPGTLAGAAGVWAAETGAGQRAGLDPPRRDAPGKTQSPWKAQPENMVRVSTLAAGLEGGCSVLFLVGLADLEAGMQKRRISDGEREAARQETAAQIRAALAQVKQRIILLWEEGR